MSAPRLPTLPNPMQIVLSVIAALGATAFAVDLGRSALSRPRPHVNAYAAGTALFALASWALVVGVSFGWQPWSYKTFFLFGAILNIPLLALGSMFLVAGPRSARTFSGFVAVLSLWSTLTISFAPLAADFPQGAIPAGSESFLWRIYPALAGVGGGVGAIVLGVLAIVSIFRFRTTDRRLVAGNALILAGTVAAALGGSSLAFLGEAGGFAVSLLLAVSLIWGGYRLASGRRRTVASPGVPEST